MMIIVAGIHLLILSHWQDVQYQLKKQVKTDRYRCVYVCVCVCVCVCVRERERERENGGESLRKENNVF
jgi:hypothetical protein